MPCARVSCHHPDPVPYQSRVWCSRTEGMITVLGDGQSTVPTEMKQVRIRGFRTDPCEMSASIATICPVFALALCSHTSPFTSFACNTSFVFIHTPSLGDDATTRRFYCPLTPQYLERLHSALAMASSSSCWPSSSLWQLRQQRTTVSNWEGG